MNKTLALLVAVALAGWTGLALNLSGSWSTKLCLLPTPTLGALTLELSSSLMAGWEVTSTSTFEGLEFTTQEFRVNGALGSITLTGWMEFSASDVTLKSVSYTIPNSWSGLGYDLLIQDGHWVQAGPSYVGAGVSTTLDLGGIVFGLATEHYVNHVITLDALDMIREYLFYLDFPPYLGMGTPKWTLRPHPLLRPLVVRALNPLYPKYFLTYKNVELIATKVTFRGTSLAGAPVTHVLTGRFEVYYFDAATGTVILTLGADTYLWYYIAEYGAAQGWDLNAPITYEIDVADLTALFLFPNYMTYTITATIDNVSVEIVFDDVSTGIQFKEATISLAGLSLCCGITYDLELALSKIHGFEYLEFTLKNFAQICCGISFDMSVKFGVDYKLVTITPKFAGFGEACFKVFGDLLYTGGKVGDTVKSNDLFLNAIRIDGFQIKCTLGDCNYVEFFTALSPEWFYTSAANPYSNLVYNPTSTAGLTPFFNSACGEFEMLRLGFCGAGCCGGKYSVDMMIFFGTGGTLFDITRIATKFSIPVMANFAFNVDFSTGLGGATCTSSTSLCVGWTFTF